MSVSDSDVRRFTVFGFAVLRNVLTTIECRSIAEEFSRAFQRAYVDLRERTAPAWLPGLGDATPHSASLAVDDGRLWTLAEQLLGCESLPCPPEVAWLQGITPWHCDDPLGIRGVKFLVYVLGPAAGLRFLPMSHTPRQGDILRDFFAESVGRGLTAETPTEAVERDILPSTPVTVAPGDVVAIDLHVWHCYQVREPRILWSPEYLAWPVGSPKSESLDKKFVALASAGAAENGRSQWPVWREWLRATPRDDRRQLAIDRLHRAGAFHGDRDLR